MSSSAAVKSYVDTSITNLNLATTYVALTDYEDTDVLTKVKNVGGTGSGLDADKLDGADLSTNTSLGTSDALIPSQNAVKTYVDTSLLNGIKSVSTNTVLVQGDDDIIEVTTGATDITITLQDLASNSGRRLKIIKVDNGTGQVIISRAGTDVITKSNLTSITLSSEDDFWELEARTGSWQIISGKENKARTSGNSIRYADGTQFEYEIDNNINDNEAITFALTFSTAPSVTISTPRFLYYASIGTGNTGATTTEFTAYVRMHDGTIGTGGDVNWQAIGRWYG